MGRRVMKHHPFTPEEIDILRARYPQEGAAKLVPVLNRKRRDILVKARALGLRCALARTMATRRVWTLDEDALIRREWPRVQKRQQSVARLADQIGVSEFLVRERAGVLGIRLQRPDHIPWTEAEDELLAANVHLVPRTIADKLQRAGFPRRTAAAIAVRRQRLQRTVHGNGEAYSLHELAALMGCSPQPVMRWIRLGLLPAKARGETQNQYGGPGDRYLIKPRDVRAFIIQHTAQVATQLATADKYWLVDLLAGGGRG